MKDELKFETVCKINPCTKEYDAAVAIFGNDRILDNLADEYINGNISYRRFNKLFNKSYTSLQNHYEVLRKCAGLEEGANFRLRTMCSTISIQAEVKDVK